MSLQEEKAKWDDYAQHRRFLIAQSERSAGVSPDEAAKRRQTAQRLGVPVQAVNDAPENAVLQEQFDKIWRDTQGLGTLRGKMTQAEFYDVAKDDTGSLAVIGELANSAGRGFFKGLNNLMFAASDRKSFDFAAGGFIRTNPAANMLGQMASLYQNVFIPPTKDKLQAGDLPALPKLQLPSPSDFFGEDFWRGNDKSRAGTYTDFGGWTDKHFAPSERLQKDREGFAKTEGFGDAAAYALTHPYMTANVAAESFGQFAPALAVGVATKNPAYAAAVMGAGSAATEYASTLSEVVDENAAKLSGLTREEAVRQVLSDPELLDAARSKAAKRGMAVGLFDGFTAGLSGRLIAGTRSLTGAAARVAGEAGIQMGGGAAGEAAAQVVTGEWTPREIVMEALAEIPTAPVEGYRNFQEGRLKAKAAEEHADHLKQQADNAAASKLTARAPDLQAEFVNESYGEENNKLFFDAQTLMQSGLAETVAQAVPHLAPQIAEAAATGGMVEMTRGDFHAFLPQETQHHLANIARMSPDAFSAAEAAAWEETEAAAEFEETAKRAHADAEAQLARQQEFDGLKARFKQELAATGRMNAQNADDAASVWASHIQSYAGRLNMTPDEFMERYGRLNVVGESLTQDGAFSQALASNPPRGWVHSENPQDAVKMWTEDGREAATKNEAVFWTLDNAADTGIQGTQHYTHSVSKSSAYHIFKEHGNAQTEKERGQIAVTAEDLARIPEIVTAPDEVVTGFQSDDGAQRVAYLKRFDDGVTVYIAEASRKKQDFRAISMRKYPPAAVSENIIKNISSQSLNVQKRPGAYGDDTTAAPLFQDMTAEQAQFGDYLLLQDARGMFDRMGNTIALLKNADASTFIHEFGHFELETMSRIERDLRGMPPSELSEGERQILADFQTTLDWFGVKDGDAWAAMSLDGQREHHEKFARGMEAYLFEGKAPSEALRGVFSRVARLLKRIYRTLAGLNVELSDDIREVFGRLLASDEQIAEAEYVNGMKLLLDGDAELRATDEAARREAQDELGRRALRDMAFSRNARNREIRRLKREYKADFARAEMDARRSIMSQPVYRAWQLFTAKMTDEDRIDGNSKAEREFRRKAKVLQGKPVYTIEKRTAPTDNKALRDWAADLFEKAGGKAVNPEIGEVALTRKSVKDSLAHGINAAKAQAFEAVPSVIENGVVVAQAVHGAMRSHYISAPVKIEGVEDIVTVLVREDVNSRRMYLHSVTTKENLLKTAPLIESTADTPVSEPRGGLYSGGLPNQALTGLDGDSAADTGVSEPRGKPDAEVLPTGKLQSEDVASVTEEEDAPQDVVDMLDEFVLKVPRKKFVDFVSVRTRGISEEDRLRAFAHIGYTFDGAPDPQAAKKALDKFWLAAAPGRKAARLEQSKVKAEIAAQAAVMRGRAALQRMMQDVAQTEEAVEESNGKLYAREVADALRSYLDYTLQTDRTALDPSSDTLMTAIAKLGGLNKDEVVREWGIDPKDKIPAPVFGMPVLRRTKGRSIDAMVEVLAEAGYLPVDSHGKADVRDLEERFSDGLKGQDWYSRHYVPREERKAGEEVVNPYALNAVRLDEAGLSGLPADWAQVLKERGMTAKTGGMHPDIAAGLILDENGEPVFSDGLDLVQALVEALPPQEAIEDTARLNLLAEKGEVPTQADFEEAADLAVHNEMRSRMIAGELNRLKASLGSVSLLKQAARVAAKERVEQMKTRDLRPSVFTRAEAAAAKSSEKAFKAGDTEAAAAHKRNQLIQNALARETLKAREEMEKTRRYLAKFDRVAKGVDIEYREQIEALLEDVELRPISLKETDRRKSAYQFVREMEEAGIQHSIDPDYVDTISRKSWRDMTVEEMRGLADTVRQLEHLGRLKNRLLSGQEKRSYEAVRDLLDATLDTSAKAQHRKAQERREAATGLQKAGALLRGGYWAHLKMSTIVRMFDNGRDGGAFFTHFLLPLKQAADKEAAMQAEVSQKLYEVLKPLAKHTGRLKNRIGGKTHYQGLGELTREQLFAVALNMGNAGNIQRLLDGEGWRMEDVQRALSSALTAQEWQAVQGVWDLLESYRPQIAALGRRMTGVEPEWVEARPFKIMSADGVEVELRGGYYPAKYDREGSGAAEKNEATTDAKAQTAAAGLAAATRRTFAKQRANEVKGRPLRLSLNVAYDAFNEIIHDLTHREAIADANRLLNSHTLDTKIRQYYGADAKRQLSRAIADIAQGNSGAAQALDGWAGRVRQNVSVAGLGFNIVSAALQLTGWIPAITRIGFANTAKALTTYAAHPLAATRAANEMSVMMANRSRTRFRELNDVANSVNGQNGVKAFVRRYAYWLMMRMQQVTDTIVWHGAMMKALDAGRSEAEAVQLADQTVLDTQGGGQTKDLSWVERGNEVQKLFTVFYAYMNTALNMGAASIATQRSKGRLAAELMLIWVIPTALNAMMKSLLTPGDDDDDLAKKLAKEQISFTLGMFVGGRELAQLGDIATGGKFYGYNGPAGLRPIADTYKFARQAQQGEFDKGLATATINILGSGFGLPSAQISRTLKGAQALDEGKTDNPAALLFGYDGKK